MSNYIRVRCPFCRELLSVSRLTGKIPRHIPSDPDKTYEEYRAKNFIWCEGSAMIRKPNK